MMLPFSHYWWPLCTLCKYLLSLVRVGYVELDIHYAKRVCLSTALQPNASLLFRQDPTKYHNSTSHLAADACYIPCKLYFWVFEARTLSFFSQKFTFLFSVISFFLKHCQRHNGPEGLAQLTKATCQVISQVQTQILIKFHLQNIDQGSTSRSRLHISISTKLKVQNIDQS